MKAIKQMDRWQKASFYRWMESLAIILLALYPLRHIHQGLDLWDTGYNYSNFLYMGTEHMDPMWLFSTYLSNGIGHLLTVLPYGKTLVGLNLYTGLFVTAMAILSYLFLTRRVKMPKWIAFTGLWTALNLCWCPTAKLYDYLTYFFLLLCSFGLYYGLTGKKRRYLVLAGVCLGLNVFVRFSNLPEMALILAVWGYGIFEGTENRLGAFKRTWYRTLWCMLGYFSAVLVMGTYIEIRYGLDAYAEGIRQLFGMTKTASDYSAYSMVYKLVFEYINNLYWFNRVLFFALVGMVLCGLIKCMDYKTREYKNDIPFRPIAGIACLILGVTSIVWLWIHKFCSALYTTYDSMYLPAVLFLMLVLLTSGLRIILPNVPKEEKLLSMIIFLSTILVSIGSNTGLYPCINYLFLAAPYCFWQLFKFMMLPDSYSNQAPETDTFSWGYVWKLVRWAFTLFPFKAVLACFLCLCLVQFSAFGSVYVFAKGTGVTDFSYYTSTVDSLWKIHMQEREAYDVTGLNAFIEANELKNTDVILYGWMPALSFYLQLPPAFNSWPDLASYSLEKMRNQLWDIENSLSAKGKLEQLQSLMAEGDVSPVELQQASLNIEEISAAMDEQNKVITRPLILLAPEYAEEFELYYAALTPEDSLQVKAISAQLQGDVSLMSEKELKKHAEHDKWELIAQFMIRMGYEKVYENETAVIYM